MKNLLSLALLSGLVFATAAAEKPNVLFISVDDLNDWAGYRGNAQVISPHMDRLAEQGMWFERAYCQYAVCRPSRASMMSGLFYHQLEPQRSSFPDDFVAEKSAELGSMLLHSYLKRHGYKTMAVGKILHRHLPDEDLDLSGGRGGWDHNEDADGEQLESNFFSNKTLTDWAVFDGDEEDMSDSEAADWAVERLGETHDDPFMLMVGFLRPHVPWHTPQRYFDLYDPQTLDLPPYRADDFDDLPPAALTMLNEGYPRTTWAIENNQWENAVHAYLASITFVDTKIGQVLAALKASPYADNTIVILWSDHGYHMGSKNTFQKNTLWERAAKVPIIIKLPPSMAEQGQLGSTDAVVSLLDLYPTIVDLCGLPPNPKNMGRSLRPLLEDPTRAWPYPAFTYGHDDGVSVRFGDYRYLRYGDGSEELYDHAIDPHEWDNVANDPAYADVLQLMRQHLSGKASNTLEVSREGSSFFLDFNTFVGQPHLLQSSVDLAGWQTIQQLDSTVKASRQPLSASDKARFFRYIRADSN